MTNHTKTQENSHAAALARFAMDAVQVTRTPHHLRAPPIRPRPPLSISTATPPPVLVLPGSAQCRSQTALKETGVFCPSGLPLPPFRHRRSVIAARLLSAIGARRQAAGTTLVDEEDPAKGAVSIRVGLASGPVTATVVGNRNPK